MAAITVHKVHTLRPAIFQILSNRPILYIYGYLLKIQVGTTCIAVIEGS